MEHRSIDIINGNIRKQTFSLALPTMFGFLIQSLYDIVDMIYIGMISASAVAATTIFLVLFWVLEILNEIIGASSVSMISQYHGFGNMQKTRLACEQTLTLKFIIGVLGSILMALALPAFYRFYSTDPEVWRYGREYGLVRLAFVPVFFSSYSVNTIFRCTGDARKPMYQLLIAAIINIILDPIFMFDTVPLLGIKGLGMGMAGAALATGIATSFSFFMMFGMLLSGKANIRINVKQLFRLDRKTDHDLLRIGMPSGLALLSRNLVGVIMLRLVGIYGTEALAVLGVGTKLYLFAVTPTNGLQMGSGILVGHALGVNRVDKAQAVVKETTVDGTAISLLFAAAFFLFPTQLLSLFLPQTDLASYTSLMYIFGFCIICLALMAGVSSAFSGSGENRSLFLSSVFGQWCIQIPSALVFTLLFHLPVAFLYASYLIGDASESVIRFILYKNGKWKQHRV